jgi:hypothetical protein
VFKRKTKTWSLQNVSISVQKKDQNLVITKCEHKRVEKKDQNSVITKKKKNKTRIRSLQKKKKNDDEYDEYRGQLIRLSKSDLLCSSSRTVTPADIISS